jgi:hypothetical protein
MRPATFKPTTRKEFDRRGLGEETTYDDYVEMERGQHEARVGKAQELILTYTNMLSAVTGERDQVQEIRNQLRDDETFWEVSAVVADMLNDDFHWIAGILKSEAKRAHRSFGERMEQIREERAAKRRAEIEAEQAEMQSLPGFGMF